MLWLQGVNLGRRFDVEIAEIDVAPLQVQGPLSEALMVDLFGPAVAELPYYGLMEAELAGASVVVSQTGFSGEQGYEIYLRDASRHAEALWYEVRSHGARYGLRVIAPAHHRRIAAGIRSWGQDMDAETSPFQVNLAYQVSRRKSADYIGKAALERQRAEIEAGRFPFKLKLVGLRLGGKPITDYASDFWLVQDQSGKRVGYVTSPWYSPELATNIALAYVPGRAVRAGPTAQGRAAVRAQRDCRPAGRCRGGRSALPPFGPPQRARAPQNRGRLTRRRGTAPELAR